MAAIGGGGQKYPSFVSVFQHDNKIKGGSE
jgi:hypothetical protein